MIPAETLEQLFAYDDWANRETLAAIELAGAVPERIRQVMAHIIAAEELWLDRVHQRPQRSPVWPALTVAECRRQLKVLRGEWSELLQDATALAGEAAYANSKGERWSSRVEDVLMHVILHSAYHRGQIAAGLRAADEQPAYTDFIHAVRQGLVRAAQG